MKIEHIAKGKEQIEQGKLPGEETTTDVKVMDAHGVELANGDTVMLIKDLPVKGFSKSLKSGTKVKNIRLTDGDHNISCKVDGIGAMGLKSEFVKKV